MSSYVSSIIVPYTLVTSLGVGLASHIGVCSDMPTVGVAKKLFHVDGIMRDEKHHEKVSKHIKRTNMTG